MVDGYFFMNRDQLEKIYDEHADAVFGLFLSFSRNETDARDLLQDWLVRISQQDLPETLRNERSWFLKTAYNLAVDWSRGAQAQRKTRNSAAKEWSEFQPESDPDREEMRIQLETSLRQLPADQQAAVRMKLWDGLSFREIGEALGISTNTAASRYQYGIAKLKKSLGPLYLELSQS